MHDSSPWSDWDQEEYKQKQLLCFRNCRPWLSMGVPLLTGIVPIRERILAEKGTMRESHFEIALYFFNATLRI